MLKEAILILEANIAAIESTNDTLSEDQIEKEHQKARDQARTTYFCLGVSDIWGKPVSVRIRALVKEHKVTWLCPKILNHKFTNLGEMFNGDLTGKVMDGIVDEDLKDKTCNCNVKTKEKDGSCLYDICFQRSMIVYKLRSKVSQMSYIGKTQDYLKKRTSNHFYDTWKLR